MCSALFAGVLAFVSMLWLPMHALDPFVRFPQVFGLSERCLAASLGEFCVLGSFGLALTILVTFVAVFTSFVTLWPSVHVLNAPVWSPMPFRSFARPFAPMVSGSGCFDSIWHVLMFLLRQQVLLCVCVCACSACVGCSWTHPSHLHSHLCPW